MQDQLQNEVMQERADEIIKKLTLEEKIGMIHGAQLFQTAGVERLGIPPLKMSDGPMGVRQEFLPSQWKAVGNSDDYVTYLPCNSAVAATWNRNIAYETGSVLGEEARGRGKDVILGPGVNIKRSPLCGRNFEYFSEDPYLAGEMAAAYIQGVQLWDVAACVKHFAVNNQETERLWVDVEIDEDALREIYFPAFYGAVKKGGVYTVMGAYNRIYGEHCCQSEFLLDRVLRREWEFDGLVISDWGGVHDTDAAANSQLDIEMSVTDDFNDYFMARPLLEKIKSGEIREETIDRKVRRILVLMQKLHMLDGSSEAGASDGQPGSSEAGASDGQQGSSKADVSDGQQGSSKAGASDGQQGSSKAGASDGQQGSSKAGASDGQPGSSKADVSDGQPGSSEAGASDGQPGSGRAGACASDGQCGQAVGRKPGAYNTEEHRRKALEAARESIILLKNDRQILPLKPDKQKRILLIGENARQLHASGGGSAEIKALYEISPLMGLKSHLGGNAQVAFAQGYCSKTEDIQEQQEMNWQEKSLENGGGARQKDQEAESSEAAALAQRRKELREEAVRLAADYDTVIFIGGLDHTYDCEGNDRADMKLPYEQDLLIQKLLEVKKDMIVIMMAGSPVEMGSWISQADTVVWSWYAGMEGGNALADVLLGLVNPSGKLPETFYKTHQDCSAHAVGEFAGTKSVAYREGSYVGYRYNDKYQIEPEFCFGHGLSYTTFAYTDAKLDPGKNQVCCTIENTGAYDGSEAVQVYVRKEGSKFFQELCGFEKVFVKAGQKAEVKVTLEEMKTDAVYCIGSSSRDIRLSVSSI